MDTHFLYKLYIVKIVVLYRVTAQYGITPKSSYAVKNKEFYLTCNIGPLSAVPSFSITWRRNDKGVAIVQSSNCTVYKGTGGQELYQRYTYNCTSNRSYNLYISSTQINSEDGSVWRCEENDPRLGSSTDYTLNVYDPPTADPLISGYSGKTTYLGNTITLTCTLDGGKPLATLTWTFKGLNVQGVNASTQTSAISRYTVTIDTSYNGQTCTCTASHQIWSYNKQVQSQPFVVHYPPTANPVLSGYDGTFRYQDDKVTLTCTVSGGSPPATLSWTCDGQHEVVIRQSTSGTTVTCNIRVTMKKELDEKTCICHGRHSDTRYSPNVSSNTFIVYYPPSNLLVEVSADTPFPWIERGNGQLRCSVDDGNPTASYEWLSSAGIISGQTSHILSLTSLTKDDNRKGYNCKVSNAYTIAKNLNLLSGTIQLNVEYNPVVTVGISPAYIRETDTFERLCTADGNPPPTISWTSNTSPSNGAILKLVNTMSNQTGNYTCRAQAQSRGRHGLLSGQAVLNVIVQLTTDESNVTGTIIGIVVALAIILVVVCIIGFFLLRKRRSSNGTNRKDGVLVNGNSNASPNNGNLEDEEDGIRSNILYEPAGANFKNQDTARNKSGEDNPAALYADVQKKKPPKDPSPMYAEVHKPDQKQKGDKKDKTTKVSKRHCKTGMLYENVRQDKNGDANMLPSAGEVPGSSTGAIPKEKQTIPTKSRKTNKDGLTYVDLELKSQTSDKKTVIHGNDNRTDYTEVDFSRQAIPLQPRS